MIHCGAYRGRDGAPKSQGFSYCSYISLMPVAAIENLLHGHMWSELRHDTAIAQLLYAVRMLVMNCLLHGLEQRATAGRHTGTLAREVPVSETCRCAARNLNPHSSPHTGLHQVWTGILCCVSLATAVTNCAVAASLFSFFCVG
jgi:hypothetical protein